MTVDRAIGIAGLIEGLVGIIVTVIVAGKARQIQAAFDRRTYSGTHEHDQPNTGPSTGPDDVHDGSPGPSHSAQRTSRPTLPPRSAGAGRSSAHNGADPDPAALLLGAAVVFVALSAAAIWLTEHQQLILRVAAITAIAASAVAVAVVLYRYRSNRTLIVRWPVLLLVVDAVIALAPGAFANPPFDEGRFDHLATSLPTTGSLIDRADTVRHTYGDAVVGHILEQNLGVALAVAIALLCVYCLARAVTRCDNGAFWTLTAATVIAIVAVAGLFTTVSTRLAARRAWRAGQQDSGILPDAAPPIALQRLRDGQLLLLITRCGHESIRSLTINNQRVPLAQDRQIASVRVPAASAAPLTVAISSTRYFRSDVTFAALPRRGGFVSARPDTTYAAFRAPEFPC